ncbi:hypothetical protein LMG1866_05291 [Achromobacter ruhlandii]|uniref:DUF2894 domain-containing protein n=1 Tax=Achromobacter ruhlandii TaxID=72557 RepID=UPI001465F3D6|nr:hypothetical protein LMG1866_05291 [Achromobacter ruhlandii]
MASDGGLGPALTAGADAAPADATLATLQAWRERGDDRLDPIAFHFIEALARRAAAHAGAARARLDERLAQLLRAYAARVAAARAANAAEALDDAATPDASPAPATAAPKPARGPLAELAAYLAYPGAPGEDPDAIAAQARRDAYPDLPVLDGLREIWSGLSADRQVRQSQEQVHKNAGPLNSNQLVHRALSLMRELSPGYLQQFVTYTETLAWMEQITAAAAPPSKEAPRAAAKKSARAKSR